MLPKLRLQTIQNGTNTVEPRWRDLNFQRAFARTRFDTRQAADAVAADRVRGRNRQFHRAWVLAHRTALAHLALTPNPQNAQVAEQTDRAAEWTGIAAPRALDKERCEEHDEHDAVREPVQREIELEEPAQAEERAVRIPICEPQFDRRDRFEQNEREHDKATEAQHAVEAVRHTDFADAQFRANPRQQILHRAERADPATERAAREQHADQQARAQHKVRQVRLGNVLPTTGDELPKRFDAAEGTERVNRRDGAIFGGKVVRDAHVDDERGKAKLHEMPHAIRPRHARAPRGGRGLWFQIEKEILSSHCPPLIIPIHSLQDTREVWRSCGEMIDERCKSKVGKKESRCECSHRECGDDLKSCCSTSPFRVRRENGSLHQQVMLQVIAKLKSLRAHFCKAPLAVKNARTSVAFPNI